MYKMADTVGVWGNACYNGMTEKEKGESLMKKSILASMLTIALVLSLAACGNNKVTLSNSRNNDDTALANSME